MYVMKQTNWNWTEATAMLLLPYRYRIEFTRNMGPFLIETSILQEN